MYGALIGDAIGSFWEFSGNKDPDIPLWIPACRFTDDSVCTGAVAGWLLEGGSVEAHLHATGRKYPKAGWGGNMLAWLQNDTPTSYASWGNGSAMRVSPVALWATNEDELLDLARQSAVPTHGSEAGIRGAQAIAMALWWAMDGAGTQDILMRIEGRFGYCGLATMDPEMVRPSHIYDVSCNGTVPLALAIALRAQDFADTMRWCCSMGGDADTLAAIAGPLAEVLHGIPQEHVDNARLRFAGTSLWDDVERLYRHPRALATIKHGRRKAGRVLPATTDRRVPPRAWRLKQEA